MKVGLGSDKSAFRHFFVQNPVAVEEDVLKSRKTGLITESSTRYDSNSGLRACLAALEFDQRKKRSHAQQSRCAEIFGKAIAEHLEVVRQLEDQQLVLEAIARAMMQPCVPEARFCGAATAVARPTRST